jgi:hypothetical protein
MSYKRLVSAPEESGNLSCSIRMWRSMVMTPVAAIFAFSGVDSVDMVNLGFEFGRW